MKRISHILKSLSSSSVAIAAGLFMLGLFMNLALVHGQNDPSMWASHPTWNPATYYVGAGYLTLAAGVCYVLAIVLKPRRRRVLRSAKDERFLQFHERDVRHRQTLARMS